MITQQYLVDNFNYNKSTGELSKKSNGYAGYLSGNGYKSFKLLGHSWFAHRLVWIFWNGENPEFHIDHVNRDKTDNRIENLRLATFKSNNINVGIRADNKSGVKGVHWCSNANKWRAMIKNDGKKIHIGYYHSIKQAEAARKREEKKLWGKIHSSQNTHGNAENHCSSLGSIQTRGTIKSLNY